MLLLKHLWEPGIFSFLQRDYFKNIVEREGIKNSFKIVVVITSFTKNAEAKIYFRIGE